MLVRDASLEDATAIQAIYAPVVTGTVISFEETPPTVQEMAGRIADYSRNYPYLVAEADGRVLGYAYGSRHRDRAAYRSSVDVAVYVDEAARGRRVGRSLYDALLPRLAAAGAHAAFAGITLPNAASVRLHESLGSTPVGVYRGVGYEHGRWHDVGWWQLTLATAAAVAPDEPRPWSAG